MKPAKYALGIVFAATAMAGAPTAHAAAPVEAPLSYTHASSQFDAANNATRYHPLNLIDRDPNTLWCEGRDNANGEGVEFFFKSPQVVDRVVVIASARSGRRIDSVRLSDGQAVIRVAITPDSTDAHLSNALRGNSVTVSIDHVGVANPNAEVGANVACLAEVQLYHGDELLTPASDRATIDGIANYVVGDWNAEPLGAPERHIVFALDGTWTWTHTPLVGGASQEVTGTYKFHNQRLLMRKGSSGRWLDAGVHLRHVVVDQEDLGAPRYDYDTIKLNKVLGDDVGGEYNNARF